jgi:glycosyltransferase involved in cell wall biosynthesis
MEPQSAAPDRPAIAIIANAMTPYRLHLHRRIVSEVPEIKLFSVFTHDVSNAPWALSAPKEISPVMFGHGETSETQGTLSTSLHEWHKGARIIEWMAEQNIRAVVLLGYNDPGRLRILRWCARHEVPIFLWGDSNIHGDTASGWRAFVKANLVRRIVKACDGVMPCGSLGAQYFAKYGATPQRTFLMPYEPDYQMIQQVDASLDEQTRQKFGLNPTRRRIVFSGRLIDIKRPELVIDAFARIAGDRPQWDLLMIGAGVMQQALQERVPQSLKERIVWTGFVNDQKILAALYRVSDLLVLPSDYEPWAVVINEAAAAGLAIIASDVVGAAAELVHDGVNGHLFHVGDLADLTRCLFDVTDPNKIDAMKSASATVLADWRKRADPVQGLRDALAFSGVIGK